MINYIQEYLLSHSVLNSFRIPFDRNANWESFTFEFRLIWLSCHRLKLHINIILSSLQLLPRKIMSTMIISSLNSINLLNKVVSVMWLPVNYRDTWKTTWSMHAASTPTLSQLLPCLSNLINRTSLANILACVQGVLAQEVLVLIECWF